MDYNNKTQSIETIIKIKLRKRGKGHSFTANDFLISHSSEAVYKALQRLEKKGVIRRLAQGLYDYPQKHPKLGLVPPDCYNVAQAIARSKGIRIQPSGAYAANILGLSEQVPAKVVFLTDGLSKKITIDNMDIVFKKTTPNNMKYAGTKMGLIIHALKNIGKKRITPKMQELLKTHLKTIPPQTAKRALKSMPGWMRSLIIKLQGDLL